MHTHTKGSEGTIKPLGWPAGKWTSLPVHDFNLLILSMHFKIYIPVKFAFISPVLTFCLMFALCSVPCRFCFLR